MFLESKHDRHPTEFARLNKIRLTVAQETPKGRAWDEAKIKNMTGGDPIPARFMHQNFFDVIPSHKLIIAGNHKPKLKVVDEAIRARLLLIPFTVTIPRPNAIQNSPRSSGRNIRPSCGARSTVAWIGGQTNSASRQPSATPATIISTNRT